MRERYPKPPVAPAGAPNVLVIMTDDVGFAASSTFGGPIPTPAFDALAKQGAKYNAFNTSAVCSPTRAALLTGRDPHRVNMGMVPGAAGGYAGQNSVIPDSAAMISQVLKDSGYNTAIFGKWHLTPAWEQGPTGPFDRWPTHMGFEYFYGFIGGEINQFSPKLVEGTKPIQPAVDNPDYHFDEDMANHTIDWIRRQESLAPDKPFFIYYAPGTAHAPHHAPAEWLAKFKGMFDQGWDTARVQIFEQQKARGVIPSDARLTPRPSDIPAWNDLNQDERKQAARHMEAYAAALAHADYQIGRVISSLKETGQFDNTMIIYIQGDNGPSAIGGRYGSLNDEAIYNLAAPTTIEDDKPRIDEIGGPKTASEYPIGWGHALATPFQYYKAVASHFGGIRNGTVISWPKKIASSGIRPQFHYVTDVFPTILEAAGISAPKSVKGVDQMPLDGISMIYTFDNLDAPTRRKTQHFVSSDRLALYHDGWIASATPSMSAFKKQQRMPGIEQRQWELYNLNTDFSQSLDVAAKHPEKLRELKDMFWTEASRSNALPIKLFSPMVLREATNRGKHSEFYPGTVNIAEGVAPAIDSTSFRITARVEVRQPAKGILVTQGGRFMGYAFYAQGGKLAYTYNYFDRERTTVVSDHDIPMGKHELAVDFRYDGGGLGKGGKITLLIDGKAVGTKRIEKSRSGFFQTYNESFDVGEDTGTPVIDSYTIPFSFNGGIEKVIVDIE